MSGVDTQADFVAQFRAARVRCDCRRPVISVAVCVGTGVKFNPVRTDRFCAFNHFFNGVDEDRSPNARLFKLRNNIRQSRLIFDGIPTRIGGQLVGRVGYERHLMRFILHDQIHKFRYRIAFDIKFRGANRLQFRYIRVVNMPLIGARMHGNSLPAEGFDVFGNLYQIGEIAAARVAQKGDFIDIYGETNHFY